MPDVKLREVSRSEKALFYAHFQEYLAELSLYSGARPDRALPPVPRRRPPDVASGAGRPTPRNSSAEWTPERAVGRGKINGHRGMAERQGAWLRPPDAIRL